MENEMIKLTIGALLHDVGKVVYRGKYIDNHSKSGFDFLQPHINDKEILDQVMYHHKGLLKKANVSDNSLAYITYIADNIASMADRREDDGNYGFDSKMPLESIFNRLNNNDSHLYYQPKTLDSKGGINYPGENKSEFSPELYNQIIYNISDNLKGIEYTNGYVNSLLEVLEANCTFIPSSTATNQPADVSLFDHVRLTAAMASAIYEYLNETGRDNYKKELFSNESSFYKENAFLMYSFDISGIQDFIYTISSKGALKGLRARSFYLEILCEHIIDELLDRLSLFRSSLVYSGGGHAYILLSNTEKTKEELKKFEDELNKWFLSVFDISLFVGGGYSMCSALDLSNAEGGAYSNIFKGISEEISKKKAHRYEASSIQMLNNKKHQENNRECTICKRSDHLEENDICTICACLLKLSDGIINKDFFSVVTSSENGIILPFGKYLEADTKDGLVKKMNSGSFVRCYCKNKMYTGKNLSTKIWVGDYVGAEDFGMLTKSAIGIKRLGVLRGDIDNLGQTFVSGFNNQKVGDKYVSFSRTATLSRKLSLYFKLHINSLLENGECDIFGHKGRRNAVIVYSGGDDFFIVGSYDDIICVAIDIYNSFSRYADGALTFSCGIGLFPDKYPISAMAGETGKLEDAAKEYPTRESPKKNSICLFDPSFVFGWESFTTDVIGEKFDTVGKFFSTRDDKGKSFIYKIVDYLRNSDDKINIARLAYLLARIAPDDKQPQEKKDCYNEFVKKMYGWSKNETDRKSFIAALYLYTYMNRN